MAPKKKSRAESSSSSTFDTSRFPSLGKSNLFFSSYASRNVESEREVADELHDKRVFRSLAVRNWFSLVKFNTKEINVDLVREFYCNLEILENGSVKSYVRGKWITVSANDIANFLNIPLVDLEWIKVDPEFSYLLSPSLSLCGRPHCFDAC